MFTFFSWFKIFAPMRCHTHPSFIILEILEILMVGLFLNASENSYVPAWPQSSFRFPLPLTLASDSSLLCSFPDCSPTPTCRQMCRLRLPLSWGGTQACPSRPPSTSRPSRPLRKHARPCTPSWTTLLPSWPPAASLSALQAPGSQLACL